MFILLYREERDFGRARPQTLQASKMWSRVNLRLFRKPHGLDVFTSRIVELIHLEATPCSRRPAADRFFQKYVLESWR